MTIDQVGAPIEPTITKADDARFAEVLEAERVRRGPLRQAIHDLASVGELRRTPYGLVPLIAISLTAFFQVVDETFFRLATPEFLRHGISVRAILNIGQLVGVFSLAALLALGWYADRRRRLPILWIGTLISGLGIGCTSLRFTTGAVGGARIVGDTAGEASNAPYFSLITDYYPIAFRGRAFSFVANAAEVGRLISLPAGAIIIAAYGLRTSFMLVGALIVASALFMAIKLREPIRGYWERLSVGAGEEVARVEDEPQSFGEAWRSVFAVRTVRRLFIADMVGAFAGPGLTIIFTALNLTERYGLDLTGRAWFSVPGVVLAFVGGLYGGGLLDRFSRRDPSRMVAVIAAYNVLTAVAFIGYALHPALAVLLIASAIGGFGSALNFLAVKVLYANALPSNVRVQGFLMISLAGIPVLLFGYTLAFNIFNTYGYGPLFVYFAVVQLIVAPIFLSAGPFLDNDRRNSALVSVANEEWRRAKAAGRGKMLICRNVDVAYDGVQVLFGVDFDVEQGELIALLGTNGAGKSTLLRAISGSQEASAGAIVFNGRDITHMPPHEIAARGIVHMPGGRGLFPGLTVRDNLIMGTWLSPDAESAKADLAEVYETFPALKTRLDDRASLLSGGEQQTLSLAQAFLMKPTVLMIDELSLGLSPTMVGQLLDIVRKIHERGVTIIVVEQSVNVALSLATKAVFMEKGEVKFVGPAADLLARPDLLRAVYVKGTGSLTDAPGSGSASTRRTERQQRALELGTARPVLEAEDIVKRFGGVVALDGASISLRDGEILGLIGPNGSGKTTLLDIISGFVVPDGGHVRFEGVDVTGMSPDERARRKLVRRFQDAKLFPSLTVFETLLVSLEHRNEVRSTLLAAISAPQARRSERRLRVRAERLVELLELGAFRDKFVKELSTGLRRIVDLACVLAAEPRVLLLDEPSSGIAQAEAEGLAPLLRRVKFETGCSIIIIEHDMPLISAVADELVALDQGSVLLRGTPEVVLNDDRVIEAYLGGSEAAVNRSGRQ